MATGEMVNKRSLQWLWFRLGLVALGWWFGMSATGFWLLAVWTAGDIGMVLGRRVERREIAEWADILKPGVSHWPHG